MVRRIDARIQRLEEQNEPQITTVKVAWGRYENPDVFGLDGKHYTRAELDALDLGDDVLLICVTFTPSTEQGNNMSKLDNRVKKLEENNPGADHPGVVDPLDDGTYRDHEGRIYTQEELDEISKATGLPVLIWDIHIPQDKRQTDS